MSKIYKKITELTGNTPIVELSDYAKASGVDAVILAKLESFNPAGSVKDRIAKTIIEDAEKRGILKKGSVIIEPTSGNTGIGLACMGAAKGYKVILTMPETMSIERVNLLKAYGAEIVLTEGSKGMKGSIEKAEEIARNTPGSFIAGQFTNKVNPQTHFETTGPEIYNDTDGKIDAFVAGVGSGGTLTGTGQFLKSKNKNIKVIAVEPADSPLLSQGKASAHGIQGIGANFVPDILDTQIYDEIITATTQNSFDTARLLVKTEGILVGISSGAALYAATEFAKRPENKGKVIVVVLADTGERYLSTPLFSK